MKSVSVSVYARWHLYVSPCIATSLLEYLMGTSYVTCSQMSSESSKFALLPHFSYLHGKLFRLKGEESFITLPFFFLSFSYNTTAIPWLNMHIKYRIYNHFSPFFITYVSKTPHLSIISCLCCCNGFLMISLLHHVSSEAHSLQSS